CILPHDVQESDPRPKYRHGESHSDHLPGRLGGSVSAPAGRCVPGHRRFRPVFRNNAVMSAMGIPQIAAIMGMCVAGGGYLPVMCDHVLMTDGSGLFLAGPALVQAAIGQKYSAEELGGAAMHSAISGTADFREPNDQACIARIRSI